MRVAVVSNFYPPEAEGGAEIFAKDLCDELGRRGFSIEVFTSTKRRERVEESGNVTVRYYRSAPPFSRFASDLLGYNFNPWARNLAKALSRSTYDIVHVHNLNSTIMLSPLLNSVQGPVICHVHDHWPVCYRGFLFDTRNNVPCTSVDTSCCFNPGFRAIGRLNLAVRRRLLDRFESKTCAFVAPSWHMRQALLNRGFSSAEKIRMIRLGLDFGHLTPGNVSREDKFVFAGRLVGYKNPQIIPRLIAGGRLPGGVKFRILGRGPATAELQSAIRSLHPHTVLEDDSAPSGDAQGVDSSAVKYRVQLGWVPTRSEVLAEIQSARGLLVPSSVAENSPVVIIEALASGTPVLCTSLGGAGELVMESGGGEVLSPDDFDGWERGISSLLAPERFEELSRRAARYAKDELDIARCAAAMETLYDEVAG